MATRNLDPQLEAILTAIEGGGMFDAGITYPEMREKFAATAPMMWNPANLPVHATEDRVIPGPGGDLPVRVYTPHETNAPLPILVYFHGGGFTIGSIETADPMSRFLARSAECVVVNVGCRMAPEDPFPAPVDDCFAAVRWAAEHAAEIGGDAARLAVGGDASGATYAAVCALLAKESGEPPLVFQLLLTPATDLSMKHPSRVEFADDPMIPGDMIDALMNAYAPDGVDRADWRVSPLLAPDLSGLPPAFVLTAEYDFLRDEDKAYADRLAEAGVPVTYRCWPGTVHNFFSMYDHLEVAREAMAEAAAALRAAFYAR
jgi:acetyl esterase